MMNHIKSELLDRTDKVIHGFFQRTGGVSPAPFDSLNFSKKREGGQNFLKNLEIAANELGLDINNTVLVNYDHCYDVIKVGRQNIGEGIFKPHTIPHADGILAAERDVTLMTIHADCVPIFLLDSNKEIICLCHAGWRGVYSHIAVKAVDLMCENGADADDIICAVGPCIEKCCFEVSQSLADDFALEFGSNAAHGRNIDLRACLDSDLISCGVQKHNIEHFGLVHTATASFIFLTDVIRKNAALWALFWRLNKF